MSSLRDFQVRYNRLDIVQGLVHTDTSSTSNRRHEKAKTRRKRRIYPEVTVGHGNLERIRYYRLSFGSFPK